VEALFLFALLFASFAQCKYTSQRCLFFHSLWFVTRNNATRRQQWSEFGSTRSYRNNDTSNGEIDTTTSDEGKIKVTFCALRPVLPVGTRGATAAWMESGVMTMYYNIDESWLVFVKTDKISLNRFCWFIENQSDRFFFENLENLKKIKPKKSNDKPEKLSDKLKIDRFIVFSFKIWILNKKPVENWLLNHKNHWVFVFFSLPNFEDWILY
jgi:hypothetical protein